MTKTERDDLIRYLDNEAGPQPSKVNKAHEDVQYALSKGDLGAALLKTIEAEGYNGQVGIVLQTLRDKLAAITVDPEAPPELPPVTPPQSGPGPIDPVPNDGARRNFGPMFQNTTYTTHAGGDGSFSFSTASGNAWHKMWVNDVLVIDGGMTPIGVKAGDKIDMQITTQTQGNATYSLNKYG